MNRGGLCNKKQFINYQVNIFYMGWRFFDIIRFGWGYIKCKSLKNNKNNSSQLCIEIVETNYSETHYQAQIYISASQAAKWYESDIVCTNRLIWEYIWVTFTPLEDYFMPVILINRNPRAEIFIWYILDRIGTKPLPYVTRLPAQNTIAIKMNSHHDNECPVAYQEKQTPYNIFITTLIIYISPESSLNIIIQYRRLKRKRHIDILTQLQNG